MKSLLLVLYMSAFSRMSGGGIWPGRPAAMAEMLFVLPFSLFYFVYFWLGQGYPAWGFPAVFAWSYAWMVTGHATAYQMGSGPAYAADGRKEFLSFVVDPICNILRQPLGGTFYCWFFMALKGALLHAPLGLYGTPMAVLWPLAYFIGNRVVPRLFPHVTAEAVAELLAGAFSGACIAAAFAGLYSTL